MVELWKTQIFKKIVLLNYIDTSKIKFRKAPNKFTIKITKNSGLHVRYPMTLNC